MSSTTAQQIGQQAVVAELRRAAKSYGDRQALRGVDLALSAGEILAVLGPNGAGKTTSIKLLLGLRRPDAGQALLFGSDPRRAANRRHVAATPQELDFPPTLKVCEIIDLVRRHYPQPLALVEVAEAFGLSDVKDRQTGGLSGGQKRRLSVAAAFAANPPVIFLDEPTTGLDVESRFSDWQAVREFVR
ncbi:MAG: ABC transporter ATP-binding protein, partial [Candidatus Eremiobacteraeota bacterium]|nr:ABC transporter ATP-binding protein [Candidatus Eremiobacteraeota bacterium]